MLHEFLRVNLFPWYSSPKNYNFNNSLLFSIWIHETSVCKITFLHTEIIRIRHLTFSSFRCWSRSSLMSERLIFRANERAMRPPASTWFCRTSKRWICGLSARISAKVTAPGTMGRKYRLSYKVKQKWIPEKSKSIERMCHRGRKAILRTLPSHVIPVAARPSCNKERLIMRDSFNVWMPLFSRLFLPRFNVSRVFKRGWKKKRKNRMFKKTWTDELVFKSLFIIQKCPFFCAFESNYGWWICVTLRALSVTRRAMAIDWLSRAY